MNIIVDIIGLGQDCSHLQAFQFIADTHVHVIYDNDTVRAATVTRKADAGTLYSGVGVQCDAT